MAEIINLRQARKQKARKEKQRLAAQNRAGHGRSRTERRAVKDARESASDFLDGHRRDRPVEDGAH